MASETDPQSQVKMAPWVTSGKISTRLDWAAHIDSDTDSIIDDDDDEDFV